MEMKEARLEREKWNMPLCNRGVYPTLCAPGYNAHLRFWLKFSGEKYFILIFFQVFICLDLSTCFLYYKKSYDLFINIMVQEICNK